VRVLLSHLRQDGDVPTVKAVVFTGPRRVAVRDVDVPAPGPGEVVVRTLFSGISSGTELLAYRGEIDPDVVLDERIGNLGGTFAYPFRYGYSCVGEAEGRLVFAFHPHQEEFVARADDLVLLGDVDPREATLFPLVETALQISLDAGPLLGIDVVVLGLGAVGVLTALLMARAGAHVTGVDPQSWRRRTALALGVPAVELGDAPHDVPLVVEASGNPAALADALGLLAHEGTALVASWYGTKHVSLPLGGAFHRRRLTLRSTQVSTIPAALRDRWSIERRRATGVELLQALPLHALATHAFPVTAAADAFAALDRADEGLIHAALGYG
jgi:threonine dehydrogenase-like Zn-dependent dehydrogenase